MKIFLVGRKAVKILQTFDNSYLIEYVVSKKQCSICKDYVKSKIIDEKQKSKPKQLKIRFKK